MTKEQIRRHAAETDSAAAQLETAHTEIMDAWFDQWRTQERSRIDLAFRKGRITEQQRKQVA